MNTTRTISAPLRLCASALKTVLLAAATIAALPLLAAPNPPTAEDPMISITPVTRSMAQTGGTAAINTAGSGTWRASVSANWILLTSSSGSAGYPVGYTVSANNGVEARVGYVYVSGYVHTITQVGLGATLASYSVAFESEGGTGSVRVNAPAGKTWHAQSNADWIAVSTESGTGSGDCAFTVAAFDEVSTRSGTLTIADNTFTVVQTGLRMQLTATGATTDYFAETIKIRVNALASTEWAVSVNAGWMTVTDAGNSRGGDEVKVAVAENPSYNERNGVVTIGTETFTIRQLGRTSLVFRINPTEVSTFGVDGATGERIAVTATPDLGWTAAASADWIELYSGYASGAGNGSLAYKVRPNPTLYPRSGSITVTAADGAVAAKRLDIRQEAAVASLTVGEYEFAAAGESLTVGVNTGNIVEWGVTNLPAWLSVSTTSSTGPVNITLTAAANTSVQPRSGVVRIADHEFRVSQKGRGVTISYDETRVFDADGKTTGENVDNVIQVTADSDVEWTAVASDPTWMVVYEGASGKGNGTVKYIVAPYIGSGEIRTGMITIGSEIAYVTQRPYDLSIEPNGTWVDGNAGAGEIQVALDIEGVWNAIATEPWITIVSGYDAGTGSGKVLFSFTDNNTGRQRTGKIIIAGETYTLTQAARQLVAISASAGGRGGTVTGSGTYELDSEIELEAVPGTGYAFDHWVLPDGGTSTENPLSVAVTAAQSYQAFFSPLAPQLAVASASLRGVSLEWTDLPWATELRVFRGTSSTRGQASLIATLPNNGDCEYLDATGTENQDFWYWVEAVGIDDDLWSNGVQGRREKKSFSITYTNLRGTTHSNPSTYREGTAVAFAAPSARTGFEFLGWTPSGIMADTSGNLTVRANWSQNEYTVRFDPNGATGSMPDEAFTYGLWKYLSPTNFSHEGYTFLGWAVKPASTVAAYDDSVSVKSLTAEPNGLVTLYALWLHNGLDDPLPDLGESASSSDIVAVLVGCVDAGNLGENITSAAEYADFRAWADAVRDGSGAAAGHTGVRNSPHAWLSYALGQGTLLQAAPEPGDLVILDFAASESDPNRFDLLFGLEGIVVGDSAKSANLMKTFAVEGTESLEEAFSKDAVVTYSLAPFGGCIAGSIQPAWASDSFFFRVVERPLLAPSPCSAIFFDSAGGSQVEPITQVCGTGVVRPAAPTRTGYAFAGWSPALPAAMPADDMVCVAQWTPIQYTVQFNANGGTGEMENLEYSYEMDSADCGLVVRYYDISSSGYSTWRQSETAMTNYFASRTPTIVTNTVLFGDALDSGVSHLAESDYNKFVNEGLQDLGFQVGVSTNRFHGKYAQQNTDYFAAFLSGFIRIEEEGTYTFAIIADDYEVLYIDGIRVCNSQWNTVGSGSTYLSAGDHRFTMAFYEGQVGHGFGAQWKKPGDSSYSPLPQSALFHRKVALISDCAFARVGHSFIGWATEPDGEVVYGNSERAASVFPDNSETTKTLYAVWRANQYTISFNSNGGSSVSSITEDYGLPVTAPDEPTLTGYAFAGWLPVVPTTMPPSNVVCVAQWTKTHSTISFNAAGGSAVPSVFLPIGSAVVPPANPTRTGYTFTGWSPDLPATMPAEDMVCVAQWTPIQYTVQFNANGGTGAMESLECNYDMFLEDCRLVVRYYDISTCGYSTWRQSETAMTNYFASRTPTIVTNTVLFGDSLDTGVSNLVRSDYDKFVNEGLQDLGFQVGVSTNRFHGKYAQQNTDYFAAFLSGFIRIETEGTYTFAIIADDYEVLYIDGIRVCNSQWNAVGSGSTYLSAGEHRFTMAFYEGQVGHGFGAQWKKPGDSSYSPLPQSALVSGIHGTALPVCTFSGPNGVPFLGWSTTADGPVEYKDMETVSNLASKNGDCVVLYARWSPGSYGIHFDSSGGSGEMSDMALWVDCPTNLVENSFSKPGH